MFIKNIISYNCSKIITGMPAGPSAPDIPIFPSLPAGPTSPFSPLAPGSPGSPFTYEMLRRHTDVEL